THAHPDLRSLRLDGRILLPEDEGWVQARTVWNTLVDPEPAAILQAASPDDVAAGITAAQRHRLPLAIRGAGRNLAGDATVAGGLVIDLGRLNDVGVNPGTRVVTVEGGATLGELDRGTIGYQTAVPAGTASGTGVGGLAVAGGIGWLTRAYGLSIDNLLDVHLVSARGEHVHASAQDHPDLFWGMRGAGSNFGVVTRFEFQGVPLGPEVYAGAAWFSRQRWRDIIRLYAEWTTDLPDPLTTMARFIVPMDHWDVPAELKGRPVLSIGWCWAGTDMSRGEAAVTTVAEAKPDFLMAGPTNWLDLQTRDDDFFPEGARAYFKSLYFDAFSDDLVATLTDQAATAPSALTATEIHHLGGAFGRVDEQATAFGNRDARYLLNIRATWTEAADDAANVGWVRGFWSALERYARGGHYANFLGHEEGPEARAQARASYPPATWERLVQLKNEWDPMNVFRLNRNVPPGHL
ncbi:MAG: FAD-binding oxidoreductase, partial [Chloroflexota bacterium]